ncbi:SGT1-domain-containing protein [Saitoella complicata NRRL Y-17804]|uniref:SGT1-domain-containing protein n=1 Tax=Saitoella complicata (strain BCRC 22490 / CBS 7301 / JCM 7358 / NBRC 10748 / NRRL Y-17804) TaxID=698492 RepID=UPI000868094B|nr:SGT1-domain-containing protein [Saitoella complicata NRRL Y-17804]ODQ53514.1 SGT1-domain-containing protein [Saitoella complicata NRRL Y-17804]
MDDLWKYDAARNEDAVEYTVFMVGNGVTSKEVREAKLNEAKQAAVAMRDEPWLKDYIWQKEEFGLELTTSHGEPCLKGSTKFGECIDDEWLIVYILHQLSMRFDDIGIQVTDTDGEFLLIEAAHVLPRWLNPDNADNRVWLRQGDVVIIPPEQAQKSIDDEELSQVKALSVLRNASATLLVDKKITKEALSRTKDYPAEARDHLHRARITVPRSLAQILHTNPKLIAPAIDAFYTRDAVSLAACSRMTLFSPDDSVIITARFTKTLYAQIRGQRFDPPRPFVNAGVMPRPGRPGYEEAETGMKVACGFEMMCAGAVVDQRGDEINVEEYDFASDPKWAKFIDQLKGQGFFRDEMVGSAGWKKVEKTAKEAFVKVKTAERQDATSPVGQVLRILKETPLPSDEDLEKWDTEADDDKWMEVDQDDLEKLLDERRGAATAYTDEEGEDDEQESRTARKLREMVDKFGNFLNNENAGFEGAEFEDDFFDEDFDEEDEDADDFDAADGDVEFNEEDFMKMLTETLDLAKLPGFTPASNVAQKAEGDGKADKGKGKARFEEVDDKEEKSLQDVMDAMDAELAGTSIGQTFATEEDEDDRELDIDFNLAKNMLESFKSQGGLAGPGGNLLARMGISLPNDEGSSSST